MPLAWVTSRGTSVVDMASGIKEAQAMDSAYMLGIVADSRKHMRIFLLKYKLKGALPQEDPRHTINVTAA
jgi:hypothetical protein